MEKNTKFLKLRTRIIISILCIILGTGLGSISPSFALRSEVTVAEVCTEGGVDKKNELPHFDLRDEKIFALDMALNETLWGLLSKYPSDTSLREIQRQYTGALSTYFSILGLSMAIDVYLQTLPLRLQPITRHIAAELFIPLLQKQKAYVRMRYEFIEMINRQRTKFALQNQHICTSPGELQKVAGIYKELKNNFEYIIQKLQSDQLKNLLYFSQNILKDINFVKGIISDDSFWNYIHQKRLGLNTQLENAIAEASTGTEKNFSLEVITVRNAYEEINQSLDNMEIYAKVIVAQKNIARNFPPDAARMADVAMKHMSNIYLSNIFNFLKSGVQRGKNFQSYELTDVQTRKEEHYDALSAEYYVQAYILGQEIAEHCIK